MFNHLPWADGLTWLLSLFFIINGAINLAGPPALREGFARWGFPSWWHLVNAAVLFACGILLAFPDLRFFGFALGLLECLAIYAVLIRHGDYRHLPPSIVLLLLMALAFAGLYGPLS